MIDLRAIPLNEVVTVSLVLFFIGVIGVLTRKNSIIILMCVEMMLNAVNLLITSFSVAHGEPSGQIFVFFIMAVAAAEAAIGLAIIVMIYRSTHSTDIDVLSKLKG